MNPNQERKGEMGGGAPQGFPPPPLRSGSVNPCEPQPNVALLKS